MTLPRGKKIPKFLNKVVRNDQNGTRYNRKYQHTFEAVTLLECGVCSHLFTGLLSDIYFLL
jgi:hypothetical protein